MKTIEEIQSKLRTLAHELEELKESRSAGEREIDFERLSIDGSHKPITPHPLENYDEYAQKCYLTMLLTVARFDDDKLPVSLLFAHRLAFGMKYLIKGENLQEEYIAAQTLSYKQLDDLVEVFKGTDERLMLILECMLTAGMFGKGKKDAIDYIVQLSQLLELSRDDMVFLSNMAAVILTQDLNAYKCDIRNKYDVFNCYLNSFDLRVGIVMEVAMALYDKERKIKEDENPLGSYLSVLNDIFTKLQCTEVYLDNNLNFKYVNAYSTSGIEKILSQIVNKNFVLLVKAEEVQPNCPVGVEAHPLTPFSLIEKKYNDAWERFRKSADAAK